ncbi:MAG: 4-hydroxy-tetrahydrodipicolinate reductase [bacterium]
MTQNKIKVAVCGACGKMGQEVIRAVLNEADLELVAAIDIQNTGKDIGEIVNNTTSGVKVTKDLKETLLNSKSDVIVDFTSPELIYKSSITAIECGVRPVIGTTGLSEEQLAELKRLSEENKLSVLIAPNFAIGAVLMMMYAAQASKYFEHAEIIELHHNRKKDAPSGTAIKTAQLMTEARKEFSKDNIPETEFIEGARGGVTDSNIHIHSVRLPGYIASQEVIFGAMGQTFTIRHDSFNRECYMPGVVLAIKHVMKNNDFVYGLENILL